MESIGEGSRVGAFALHFRTKVSASVPVYMLCLRLPCSALHFAMGRWTAHIAMDLLDVSLRLVDLWRVDDIFCLVGVWFKHVGY